ncbi:MAG: extracellular solute-binding protein [Deinococcota bacterium]|jgi:multiple sugar transport system substrate-binding protein|nr:extracellular solute-binding protein [Deinococcota bacterium]
MHLALKRSLLWLGALVLFLPSTTSAQEQHAGTLTVSVVAGAMRDTVEPLAQEFRRRHPAVTVNLVPEPEGGAFEALIAAGNQPDLLITSFGGMIGRLASQDVVLPLDDMPGADELFDRLVPTSYEPLYGQRYYVPIGADVTLMIYNKELFEQAGLDPENPPTTWDEFLAAAEVIDNLGADTHGLVLWNEALAWGGWYWNMLQPIYLNANQNSCRLLNRLGTDIVFDREDCKLDAFFEFGRAAQQHAPPVMDPVFFSRQVGMWPQYGYSWEPNLREAADRPMVIGEDVGVAPIPVPNEGDTSYSTYGGRALIILKTNPERQNLAWAFVQFLMEEENNRRFITELGYLPVLESLQDDPYFQEPARRPFVEALEHAVLPEMTATAEAVANAIQGVYQEVVVEGRGSPEEAVEMAAERARQELESR